MLSFLHQVRVLHLISVEVNLLIGFLMHEVESVLVLVEELVWAALHVDGVDLHTGCECILKDAAVLEVTELCLYECRSLARLHVLEPYDRTRLSVIHQIKSVLEICCCCHKVFCL